MIRHTIDQNSEAWFALRMGKFTASTFADLFATKTTQTYKNAIKKVVFERLTGERPESFVNDYMKRGSELEPVARAAYEAYTFSEVAPGGFVELNEWVGCSPDGWVDDGIIEIKCPSYSTMIDYLIEKRLPSTYKYQVHGQLWITGAAWCDFFAFHPSLPHLVVRVKRDETICAEIESAVNTAITEAKKTIEAINLIKAA